MPVCASTRWRLSNRQVGAPLLSAVYLVLTFHVFSAPERGTVTPHQDGSFASPHPAPLFLADWRLNDARCVQAQGRRFSPWEPLTLFFMQLLPPSLFCLTLKLPHVLVSVHLVSSLLPLFSTFLWPALGKPPLHGTELEFYQAKPVSFTRRA